MKAVVFPGQGSQYIGMGHELFKNFSSAKDVFQEVDDVLGQNLSTLMFSGEEQELKMTENTQPALMAVSMAVIRVLEKEMHLDLTSFATFTAGHSLGEYSALCATGVYSLGATARLLRARGQAMQEAVPAGQGGMAALIGATLEQAEAVAQQATASDTLCEVANDNAPGQIVLSGHLQAIERAIDIAKESGIKRAVLLPVSAPFHSSLMQPAEQKMLEALASEDVLSMPTVPLVSNVTATLLESQDQLHPRLIEQITSRVRWVDSMNFMVEKGVSEIIEVGPGKVLTGLMRRINKDVTSATIETPEDIDALCKKIAA